MRIGRERLITTREEMVVNATKLGIRFTKPEATALAAKKIVDDDTRVIVEEQIKEFGEFPVGDRPYQLRDLNNQIKGSEQYQNAEKKIRSVHKYPSKMTDEYEKLFAIIKTRKDG